MNKLIKAITNNNDVWKDRKIEK